MFVSLLPSWSNDEQTKKGPTCWKCKGTCVRPVQKKLKVYVSGGDDNNITNNASTTTRIETNQNNNIITNQRPCPVCEGRGHLPIKSKYISSQNNKAGVITSRRRRPVGWKEYGHVPSAVRASLRLLDVAAANDSSMCDKEDNAPTQDYNDATEYAISLLFQANGNDDDYESQRKDIPIINLPSSSHLKNDIPIWLPINPGEQLCNLVGRWRILQRVASHRWTTDDLVTAYIAASTFVKSRNRIHSYYGINNIDSKKGESERKIRYLDLGTGNASVLQMVSWYLLSSSSSLLLNHQGNNKYKQLEAVGVEARSEAVGLARRSLAFNLGTVECQGKVYTGGCFESTEDDNDVPTKSMEHDVQIVQGDFRNLVSLSSMINNNDNDDASSSDVVANKTMEDVASQQYDLITGTPPYFRVGFTSAKNNKDNDTTDEVITSAVIEQGGMPSSMQSAPARCDSGEGSRHIVTRHQHY